MKIQISPPSHISGISCRWWLFAYPSKRRLCFEKLWDGQSRYGRGNLPPSSQGVALDFCEGETHTHRFPPMKVCAGKKSNPQWGVAKCFFAIVGLRRWELKCGAPLTPHTHKFPENGRGRENNLILFGKSTCFFGKRNSFIENFSVHFHKSWFFSRTLLNYESPE